MTETLASALRLATDVGELFRLLGRARVVGLDHPIDQRLEVLGFRRYEEFCELLAVVFPSACVDVPSMQDVQHVIPLPLVRESSLWQHDVWDPVDQVSMSIEQLDDRLHIEHPQYGQYRERAKLAGMILAQVPDDVAHRVLRDVSDGTRTHQEIAATKPGALFSPAEFCELQCRI